MGRSGLGDAALKQKGFTVLINRLVPCNDGGTSYGQAAVCAALRQGRMSGRPVRIEPGEGGINAFVFI